MANYTVGEMVYEHRTARGYSQEELSFGICSTSSLSRIENNCQIPGRTIFEALMQRLGVSDSLFSVYVSREEMEIHKLVQEMAWSLERLNFGKVKRIVEELEGRLGRNSHLDRQYVAFAKARVFLDRTGDREKYFEMLLAAIRMTMADFEPEKGFQRRLLTFHEITILNNIAVELYGSGRDGTGLKLLFELKEYMDTHIIDEEEKAKKYPLILYNITTRLGGQDRHQEAYELCGQAIEYCIEHNKLIALPYLLTNMASASAELKMGAKAEELFQQAVMLFAICKKEANVERVRKNAFARYGIELA